MVSKAAILSLHTSPLAQPGIGDGGGMNVYVRELVSALAQAGVVCRVYVRRWDKNLPDRVTVEPGFEVVHIDAGPPQLLKEQLAGHVDEYVDRVAEDFAEFKPDVVHANYWLSGVAGRALKQKFALPLLTTFHTLARVKAESGDFEPQSRTDAETDVINCADVVLANAQAEYDDLINHYGAVGDRIEIVPPGVDHALFSPGNQAGARWALNTNDAPLLLFVGRIQPLKGLDVAVRALAQLERKDARLWIVGGSSGGQGNAEQCRIVDLAMNLGVRDRIRFIDPQPHHLLSSYYRAADVCIVPSRSESFGLVALEASACGVPVVASAVGGLLSLVDHGHSGYLVEGRDPKDYAGHINNILADPVTARRLSLSATARARTFTWSTSAARLRRIYEDVSSKSLAACD